MAMKKTKNPTFTHNVEVRRPVDGGFKDESLTVRFLALPVDRLEEFNLFTTDGTTDYLKTIVVGWGDDYLGDDDKPIPFSDAERDELINDPPVRRALVETYAKALSGAKAGN